MFQFLTLGFSFILYVKIHIFNLIFERLREHCNYITSPLDSSHVPHLPFKFMTTLITVVTYMCVYIPTYMYIQPTETI